MNKTNWFEKLWREAMPSLKDKVGGLETDLGALQGLGGGGEGRGGG